MKQVNIHEAKTHLSRLVEAASRGEAFVIAKAGKPMVKVVPVESAEERAKRRIGILKGKIQVPDDFGRAFEDEIADEFEGKI